MISINSNTIFFTIVQSGLSLSVQSDRCCKFRSNMLLSATVSNSDKKAGDLPVGEEYKGNGSSCPLSKRSIGEERRGTGLCNWYDRDCSLGLHTLINWGRASQAYDKCTRGHTRALA